MRCLRGFVLVIMAGGALLLPACNDETPPTPIPTPAGPVRAVVASTSFTDFQPDIYFGIPIPLGQAGILDFTVDWTFPNTDMLVAFGTQGCSFPDLTADRCPFIIRTEGTTPKPRIVITQNLATGNYFLYLYSKPFTKVDGTGSGNIEAVALQIGLTVGVTGAAVPMAPIKLQAQAIRP